MDNLRSVIETTTHASALIAIARALAIEIDSIAITVDHVRHDNYRWRATIDVTYRGRSRSFVGTAYAHDLAVLAGLRKAICITCRALTTKTLDDETGQSVVAELNKCAYAISDLPETARG